MLAAGLLLVSHPRARRRTGRSGRSSARRSAAATTFVDPEKAVGKPNLAIGVSAVFLGEMFGAEVDVADAPGFFEAGDKHLVLISRVTTRQRQRGGGGAAPADRIFAAAVRRRRRRVDARQRRRPRSTSSTSRRWSPAFDVGVGAVGVRHQPRRRLWDVRRFQSVGGNTGNGRAVVRRRTSVVLARDDGGRDSVLTHAHDDSNIRLLSVVLLLLAARRRCGPQETLRIMPFIERQPRRRVVRAERRLQRRGPRGDRQRPADDVHLRARAAHAAPGSIARSGPRSWRRPISTTT